jgi:type I restriction enzyme S subunit
MPFSEIIADESGGNLKTLQSEFLSEGRFAVVDQGKELIAGYLNDESRLCKSELPVIVFGDHTRCFKYIDFPFCMGADGVKVLRPKVEAEVKYLFHYLRQIRLTDGGYDRHFKYLKRCEIPLPPLPEQQRIAAVLDKAEELRAKRRAALALLDSLGQAIFLEMFGDPVTNPKGWPTVKFQNICKRVTVGIVVKPASYYQPSGIPALRSLNIKPGKIVLENLVYFSKKDNEMRLAKTQLKGGDLVLVRSGQPGTAAVVPPELDGINAIDLLIVTPYPTECDVEFLCSFFNSQGGRGIVLSSQRGQVQKHLNVGSLGEAKIPLPPLPLQQEFARRITAVEKLKTTHRAALAELDALFASLQHRAFRGEL